MTISVIIFVVYLIVLVGIGVATYLRTKSYSDYNLAGRSNNKWVTAISAESSDMSGWLLMGLPGSAYLAGFSSIWILIGLVFGTLAIWVSLTTFGAVVIGMIGAYTFPDIADPEQVFYQMGSEFFPTSLLGLFAAAVMAAILSSVSAYVIVASSAFGANIYRYFAKGGADEKKVIRFQRAAVIVISLAAFLMSLEPDLVFAVALLATAGLGASFGPLVMFGIYTNKINKYGAVSSIVVGLVTVIVWYYSGMSNYLYEAIPGMVLSTIVLLGVSKATGGPDESITEGFNKYIAMLKSNKEKAKAERKKA